MFSSYSIYKVEDISKTTTMDLAQGIISLNVQVHFDVL
ncbi:hypothetical protein KUC_0565 [Vreelandella boliviensis LC1]|uniref:Uncharacterized protein n=1 Tax=Vreelandella boliviensis LC1 TaxID=1072583 RepID=A0A7U9C1U5_9GAMM|nr:hypothetical protein KUC_0565 [Halomonas boliviensis LC1]